MRMLGTITPGKDDCAPGATAFASVRSSVPAGADGEPLWTSPLTSDDGMYVPSETVAGTGVPLKPTSGATVWPGRANANSTTRHTTMALMIMGRTGGKGLIFLALGAVTGACSAGNWDCMQ